jgi:hypothetical protein
MVDSQRIVAARRRVAEIEGFFIHLAVFALVIALLTGVNVYTGDQWWVQWVVLGWGIGVTAHGIALFANKPRFIANWERRKFREFVRR